MQTNNKLREALETARLFVTNCNTPLTTPLEGCGMSRAQIINIIDTALAEPVKNCDVGTAEEQSKRKMEFCYNQGGCFNCPFGKSATLTLCALAWTQMPYKEGGAEHDRRGVH